MSNKCPIIGHSNLLPCIGEVAVRPEGYYNFWIIVGG
jgi:hypothetical protein